MYPNFRQVLYFQAFSVFSGNFFTNLGSILLFAIVGTTISALVVGGGVYLLGLADLVSLQYSERPNIEPVRYLDKSFSFSLRHCIGLNLLNTERTSLDHFI